MSELALFQCSASRNAVSALCLKMFRRSLNQRVARLVRANRCPLQASFRLTAGAAISVEWKERKTLHIDAGSAWITSGAGSADPLLLPSPLKLKDLPKLDELVASRRAGDFFVGAGDSVVLLPGQRVVIEALEEREERDAQKEREAQKKQALQFNWCTDAI